MFVAKLKEGILLKKLIESIKELVTDINLDVSGAGVSLQAMDSSHVALVTLSLTADGFEEYRCDKQNTLGVNITHLSKIMKCGGNDDSITLRAEDEASALNIQFENKKQKKTSEFSLSLITIDSEHLGIPDTQYGSVVTMNSNEFTRICRELYALSDTVIIETSKTSIKFSVASEVASGAIKIDTNDSSSTDDLTVINVRKYILTNF